MRHPTLPTDGETAGYYRLYAAFYTRQLFAVLAVTGAVLVAYGTSSVLMVPVIAAFLATAALLVVCLGWYAWATLGHLTYHRRQGCRLTSRTDLPTRAHLATTDFATRQYDQTYLQTVFTSDHVRLQLTTTLTARLVDRHRATTLDDPTAWIDQLVSALQSQTYAALDAEYVFHNGPYLLDRLRDTLAADLAKRGIWLRNLATSLEVAARIL
jgi:hypothetical protein